LKPGQPEAHDFLVLLTLRLRTQKHDFIIFSADRRERKPLQMFDLLCIGNGREARNKGESDSMCLISREKVLNPDQSVVSLGIFHSLQPAAAAASAGRELNESLKMRGRKVWKKDSLVRVLNE